MILSLSMIHSWQLHQHHTIIVVVYANSVHFNATSVEIPVGWNISTSLVSRISTDLREYLGMTFDQILYNEWSASDLDLLN